MIRSRPTPSRARNSTVEGAAIVRALLPWFACHARDLPWRRTRDPYAIWVSEIMLQQTQVKTVLPYWTRWMKQLPTIEALAAATPEALHKLWEGLGYYTRVRNMHRAAQIILERHAGRFPRRFEEILALPGIGRYTAGAICSIAFDQPTPILDGNVVRVLTRVWAIRNDPHDKTTNNLLWQIAEALVVAASEQSSSGCSQLNQALMELGALICLPRTPACLLCPLRDLCQARRQNLVAALPNLAPRIASTPRRFAAFVIHRRGRYFVRQRPAGAVNAHLWEFPNFELSAGQTLVRLQKSVSRAHSSGGATLHDSARSVAEAEFGAALDDTRPFCVIKHSITRYRITLEAHALEFGAELRRKIGTGRWLTLADLGRLPFAGAHRKILRQLCDQRLPEPDVS